MNQAGRRLTRWLLGTGLLSLHIGLYLLAVVALLLWNLARTPNDLWVDEPLRRWGLLVVFHTTAVAAGWAAWRLMGIGSPSGTPESSPERRATTSVEETRAARQATTGATAEEWARRWLRDSVRVVRDAVGVQVETNGQHGNGGTGHLTTPAASAVAGPEITEWGTLFARRARAMMSSAKEHLAPTGRTSNGTASPNGAPADPARTWPTPVHGAGYAADLPMPTPTNGHAPRFTPEPVPFNPMPQPDQSDDETVERDLAAAEDARWTWVEAAAAAWLARREVDPPAAPASAAPPAAEAPEETPPPAGEESASPQS